MDRPTKVKIGPYDFDVIWGDKAWSRESGKGGCCDCETLRITIYADLPPRIIAAIFVHEVMEAVQWIRCHDSNNVTSHQAIEDTEIGITELFVRNPDVMEWWMELVKT